MKMLEYEVTGLYKRLVRTKNEVPIGTANEVPIAPNEVPIVTADQVPIAPNEVPIGTADEVPVAQPPEGFLREL